MPRRHPRYDRRAVATLSDKLASGTFLLIKHGRRYDHAADGRSGLTAFVSPNGSTWTGGLVLDQRTVISYPDTAELPDCTIVVSYDHQRTALGEILIARFTESDIRKTNALSPVATRRRVIKRAGKAGRIDDSAST